MKFTPLNPQPFYTAIYGQETEILHQKNTLAFTTPLFIMGTGKWIWQ
jgi:hypothetical protein